LGLLNEQSGLLGSSYQANSALNLGANHTSSLGFSLGYAFDANNSLLAEAGFAFTKSGSGEGLLAETTAIQSRSFGATFLSKQLLSKDDKLAISLKQPLRVVAGQVGVIVPSIGEDGVAHYATEMASLVPDGREVDFKIAYDTPLRKNQALSLQVTARKDVLNVVGSRDASVGAFLSATF
jgi:hypothetical protein